MPMRAKAPSNRPDASAAKSSDQRQTVHIAPLPEISGRLR